METKRWSSMVSLTAGCAQTAAPARHAIAVESAGLALEQQDAINGDIIVEHGVCTLECSQEDECDGWPLDIMGKIYRELKTRRDGVCGMHAAFGTLDPDLNELC